MLPGGGRVFHARRVEEQVAGGGNVGRGECVGSQRDGRRRTQFQGRQGGAFVESLGSERSGFGKIDLLELRVFGETEVAYLLDIGQRDALQSVAPANGVHTQLFCGGQVDCRQALAVLEHRRGNRFERGQKGNVALSLNSKETTLLPFSIFFSSASDNPFTVKSLTAPVLS